MSQNERTRIAIIGAGIVGLTFAKTLNALDKEGKYAIDVYESAPEIAEIGAGINVWPLTLSIFKKIGVYETLIPFFDHYPDSERRVIFSLRKGDQKKGFHVADIMNEGGAVRIHRADLQKGLIQHLPISSTSGTDAPCTLNLDHRLTDYTHDNPESTTTTNTSSNNRITLHFDGKPSRKCDLLIGTDGIHSSVRKIFLSRLPEPEKYVRYREPIWSGLVAFRGLVGMEELEKVYPGHRALTHPGLTYTGVERYMATYPVSGGKALNVVAIGLDPTNRTRTWEGPWRVDVTQEDFFKAYQGFDDEVTALIQCITKPTKWALHLLDHLDVYSKQQVFLMGDAAHAMLPHLGAGATVGMEGAYILASMLTHPSTTSQPLTSEKIKMISDVYDTMMVPHATRMAKLSDETGDMLIYQSAGYGLEKYVKVGDEIPREVLEEVMGEVTRNWFWSAKDPEEDRRRAEEALLERCKGEARLEV